MTNDDDQNGEAIARRPTTGELTASGEFRGVPWAVTLEGEEVRLTIGGRSIHVMPDGVGSFVTHEMVGRWRDLGELAQMIVKYHPAYSPLARRNIA
jgi:hypothetical protein